MVPKTKVPTQVQDFTVLPLLLPAYGKDATTTATHYLYLQPNAPRIPTDNTPREVFLANVPVDATAGNLRLLFAEQLGGGRVEDVEFEDHARVGRGGGKGIKAPPPPPLARGKKRKRGGDLAGDGEGEEVGSLPSIQPHPLHRSGTTAVLRFVDATSAHLALREAKQAVKRGRPIPWTTSPSSEDFPLGEARYETQHTQRYPSHALLQESTDAYMAAFAAGEAETARRLARQRAEPDEDGFVTVVRGGRNGAARAEDGEDGGDAAERKKKKKKHKGHVEEGFYRFQVRERRKREHGELARKFDEDARRVQEMRRRRGKVRPE